MKFVNVKKLVIITLILIGCFTLSEKTMITHAEESSEECSGLENEGLVLEEEEGTEAQLV